MPVQPIVTDDVVSGAKTVPLAPLVSVSGSVNPAYLVVTGLDRDEYTAAASGATGAFAGDGATLDFSAAGGDSRGAGIVFTWQPGQAGQAGQYVNATYGALSQLDYVTSGSAGDVTNISLFTTTNLSLATQDADNAVALAQADPAGYDGSITFVTSAHPYVPTSAAQATPDRIAAAAASFVGQAWNDEGCWVLASTIAAESGAGLPVQSTAIGLPGHANGEWMVVYNGPVQASASWASLVTAGDMIVFGTPGGGGHITTCVSGTGATAMLVDNVTYEDQSGNITNSAHDGSAGDVTIAGPHPASQEWAGVAADSVVIYALDTPVVTPKTATSAVGSTGRMNLGAIASVSDPAGRAVVQIQVYDRGSHLSFLQNGVAVKGVSAAHPVTAASLAAVTVVAGTDLTSDTLEVRATNGTYWGDWEPITVTAGGAASAGTVAGLRLADFSAGLAPAAAKVTGGEAMAGGRVLPGADSVPLLHWVGHFTA
jgi:hypothetical protein